jgi:hypothetical protein
MRFQTATGRCLAHVVTDSRAKVLRHKCWLQGLLHAASACTDHSHESERLHCVAEMLLKGSNTPGLSLKARVVLFEADPCTHIGCATAATKTTEVLQDCEKSRRSGE